MIRIIHKKNYDTHNFDINHNPGEIFLGENCQIMLRWLIKIITCSYTVSLSKLLIILQQRGLTEMERKIISIDGVFQYKHFALH